MADFSKDARRVVLITGCSPGGIGYALVEEFYAKGLHVIATARNLRTLESLGETTFADRIAGTQKGKISTLALDVTSDESVSEAVKFIQGLTGGRLDILVNNAGRAYPVPALDASMTEAHSVFATNVFGVMRLVQAFTPLLISTSSSLSPSTPHPQIVMIGSISAVNPYVFGSIYNASKAALHAYSNTLRLELQPFNVGVCLIVTGGVQSNIAVLRASPSSSSTNNTNNNNQPSQRLLPPSELIKLPEGSLYKPIEEAYNRRQTHSQEGATPTNVYAKSVVEAAIAGKKEVWRGNKSWLVWFLLTVFGRWVLDWGMVRMFKLDKLRAFWIKARKNN